MIVPMFRQIHILIAVLVALFVTACGDSSPTAVDLCNQMQMAFDDELGTGVVKVRDFKIDNVYEKDGQHFAIVDFNTEFLISKEEFLKRLKEQAKAEGPLGDLMGSMLIGLVDLGSDDFAKGDVRSIEDDHLRILKSDKGWLIDLEG